MLKLVVIDQGLISDRADNQNYCASSAAVIKESGGAFVNGGFLAVVGVGAVF